MAGRTVQNEDSLEPLLDELRDIKEQLRTLQRPTGTSVGSLVNQVQQALIGITATVNARVVAFLSAGFSTGGNVNVTGNVAATGAVSAGGPVSGSTGNFPNGLASIDVYNRSLTYGGVYKIVYVHVDGTIGYVSSSRRFKQNIKRADVPKLRDVMRKLRIVTFRYKEAVENIGDDAAVEWGVIAEEIHALGLTWLVEYDDEGLPSGVRSDRFAFLALMDAQDKQAQIDALTARLDAAGL